MLLGLYFRKITPAEVWRMDLGEGRIEWYRETSFRAKKRGEKYNRKMKKSLN